MQFSEALDVLRGVCNALPGYVEWRERILQAQASAFGDDVGDAVAASEKVWHAALESVEFAEAKLVVRDLATGRLRPPPYGEMPRWIASEVVAARRSPSASRTLNNIVPEPRYRCLLCLDTGVCTALNPEWVREFRSAFLAMTDGDFDNYRDQPWWYKADREWRANGGQSPISAAVACSCSAGDRRAEKLVRHNPVTMPVTHGRLGMRHTLQEWYTRGNGGAVVWEVPDMEVAT